MKSVDAANKNSEDPNRSPKEYAQGFVGFRNEGSDGR
jgi:hypothetical protein